MNIRLLGPVQLRLGDTRYADLGGPKQRAVLALLALDFGRTVSIEHFHGMLWDGRAPVQARAAIQGHVAALRKLLVGAPLVLETQSPGYALTGEQEAVDAHLFDALAAQAATTADHQAAALKLQEALALWNGPALGGLPDTGLRRALATQLNDKRIETLTSWANRLLCSGAGATAIADLEHCLRVDGLREPVVALLIRCLHQADRTADALNAYHTARAALRDRLGIDPSQAMQDAFAEALRGGARTQPAAGLPVRAADRSAAGRDVKSPNPARRSPRQPSAFVGRSAQLQWLDQECGVDRVGNGLAVMVGPAGVGKSATVAHWAHTPAASFPDGQLYFDMHGFNPLGQADTAEVLGRFLQALGTDEKAIPESTEARAALYRQQTAKRTLLVILDDVRQAREITALLPAGPECATVVTGRSSLEDLVAEEGAAVLRLGALPSHDAQALLEGLLTADRVRSELPSAHQMIALCERLPLALRIAAARLASRPGWTIADLVSDLLDERTRLQALDTHGSLSIRSAIESTYRHLPEAAAALLARLSVAPGAEISAYCAAALQGADLHEARTALDALASYHLITESTPGCYVQPDLVRLYGRELLAGQGDAARREALARLLDYYLSTAVLAATQLNPQVSGVDGRVVHQPKVQPPITDVPTALAWFDVEERAVRGLVHQAAESGENDRAWRIASIVSILYDTAGEIANGRDCMVAGLDAARRSEDPKALAVMRTITAGHLAKGGQYQQARKFSAEAIAGIEPEDAEL